MIYQAYIQMLQPARIKERKKVIGDRSRKNIRKKRRQAKNACYWVQEKWWESGKQNRNTKIDLFQNFNESDEDLVNILIDLKPSIEGVSNFDIQFDTQVTNKVSDIDLSNQQEFEQTPEIRDSVTEAKRLKGHFCSKSAFNLSKKVLTETDIRVL